MEFIDYDGIKKKYICPLVDKDGEGYDLSENYQLRINTHRGMIMEQGCYWKRPRIGDED